MIGLKRFPSLFALPSFTAFLAMGLSFPLLLAYVLWPRFSHDPQDPLDRVIASVGGHQITLRELEQAAALSLYQVDQQRHRMLRKALQDMIDGALLEEEATRKGITVAQLLEDASQSSEIGRLANLPAPVKRLSFKDAAHDLREHTRIRQALLVSLRRQATIHIMLPEPTLPILSVSPDDDPSIGASSAAEHGT